MISRELYELIDLRRAQGQKWPDIAQELAKHEEALRSAYRRKRVQLETRKEDDYDRQEEIFTWPNYRTEIGVVADTHLGSIFAREDALNDLYAKFRDRGIPTVLHAGNLVDGHIPRINGGYLHCTSIEDQTQYVIDNYPAIPGIKTIFITGDDHEGWWQKEGYNWGRNLHLESREQGREDLCYAGHVEADLRLGVTGVSEHPPILRLQHPGGGSAYAFSYAIQKQVESFEGGEKPAILIQGHYHIFNFCNERNVWCLNVPGLQDQTVFARKRRLRFHIGGCILGIETDDNGAVSNCTCEAFLFFDRGYYKRFLKSDNKVQTLSI